MQFILQKARKNIKVVKSCLTIQNGNANVERSLCGNKNMFTNGRANLIDETLMGLRRMKEYCWAFVQAQNINLRFNDIFQVTECPNQNTKNEKHRKCK